MDERQKSNTVGWHLLIEPLQRDLLAAIKGKKRSPRDPISLFPNVRAVIEDALSAGQKAQQQARELRAKALLAQDEALAVRAGKRPQPLEVRGKKRAEEVRAPVKGAFVISGQIVDNGTCSPLAGLGVRLRAASHSRARDAQAVARTDALGFYKITWRPPRGGPRSEMPELRVEVLDEEGTPVHTSERAVRPKLGNVEPFDLQFSASKLGSALNRARRFARLIEQQIEDWDRREKLRAGRLAIRTGKTPSSEKSRSSK